MTEPTVSIRLDGNGRVYHPGERLTGKYYLEGVSPDEVKALEVSVLWCSDGKGDSDMAVHHFRRLSSDDEDRADFSQPCSFATLLPNSPLSYEGAILKLRWSVRVRAFLVQGKELFAEQTFRLGDVPPAKAPAT